MPQIDLDKMSTYLTAARCLTHRILEHSTKTSILNEPSGLRISMTFIKCNFVPSGVIDVDLLSVDSHCGSDTT